MSKRRGRKSKGKRGTNNNEEAEAAEKTSISDLPLDIIVEILSRLPTKTIVQCRCVCRTWRQLFSEVYFVKIASGGGSRPATLLLYSHGERVPGPGRFFMAELESGPYGIMKFNQKYNLPDCCPELVGSCNGLLCLLDTNSRKTYYLCNPITGEHVQTPPGPKREKKKGAIVDVVSGFGFSPRTYRYMVIRIYKRKFNSEIHSEAEVCSFGDKKWKSLGKIPFPAHTKFFGVPIAGALHWIPELEDYCLSDLICALDIDTLKFRTILPPLCFANKDTSEVVLGELGGCLCICDNMKFDEIDIWVRKEYGMDSSWAKEIVIAKNALPRELQTCVIKPIMALKDRGILISSNCNDFVSLYHPKNKKSTGGIITGLQHFLAVPHVARFESLEDIMKGQSSIFQVAV